MASVYTEDEKVFGQYPPKTCLYVYLVLGVVLLAIPFISQPVLLPLNIVIAVIGGALIALEFFAISKDKQCLLLMFLIFESIFLAFLVCFLVLGLIYYFLLEIKADDEPENPLVGTKTDKMSKAMAGVLIIEAVLLVPSIHRWLLTWQVYRHAKRRNARYAVDAATPVGYHTYAIA
ncbi:unnamed protein product [Caenorhabditis auriculariae]|uniref:Uncharacterized protein n=1 Tax=Caenorhabditis auriculariae TaxID=2777116 RepID=A0A8S1HGU2_9PELO|nr:unnamed protein product [Caenorhabditis auriculariae]